MKWTDIMVNGEQKQGDFYDADTVYIEDENGRSRRTDENGNPVMTTGHREAHINAPEMKGLAGDLAAVGRDEAARLTASVDPTDRTDQYSRSLSEFRKADGSLVSADLAQAGLTPATSDEPEIQAAQNLGVLRAALGLERTDDPELNAAIDHARTIPRDFGSTSRPIDDPTRKGSTWDRSWDRGVDSLGLAWGGLKEYVGQQNGNEVLQAEGQAQREHNQRLTNFNPQQATLKDVVAGKAGVGTFITETLGEAAPSLIPELLAAPFTGFVGGRVATGLAKKGALELAEQAAAEAAKRSMYGQVVGGAVPGALSGGAQATGGMQARLKEAGIDDTGLKPLLSGVAGVAIGAGSAAIPIVSFLRSAGIDDAVQKTVGEIAKNSIPAALKSGVVGAGLESGFGGVQNAIDQGIHMSADDDYDFDLWETLDSMVRGTVTGGALGAGGSVAGSMYSGMATTLREYNVNKQNADDLAAERDFIDQIRKKESQPEATDPGTTPGQQTDPILASMARQQSPEKPTLQVGDKVDLGLAERTVAGMGTLHAMDPKDVSDLPQWRFHDVRQKLVDDSGKLRPMNEVGALLEQGELTANEVVQFLTDSLESRTSTVYSAVDADKVNALLKERFDALREELRTSNTTEESAKQKKAFSEAMAALKGEYRNTKGKLQKERFNKDSTATSSENRALRRVLDAYGKETGDVWGEMGRNLDWKATYHDALEQQTRPQHDVLNDPTRDLTGPEQSVDGPTPETVIKAQEAEAAEKLALDQTEDNIDLGDPVALGRLMVDRGDSVLSQIETRLELESNPQTLLTQMQKAVGLVISKYDPDFYGAGVNPIEQMRGFIKSRMGEVNQLPADQRDAALETLYTEIEGYTKAILGRTYRQMNKIIDTQVRNQNARDMELQDVAAGDADQAGFAEVNSETGEERSVGDVHGFTELDDSSDIDLADLSPQERRGFAERHVSYVRTVFKQLAEQGDLGDLGPLQARVEQELAEQYGVAPTELSPVPRPVQPRYDGAVERAASVDMNVPAALAAGSADIDAATSALKRVSAGASAANRKAPVRLSRGQVESVTPDVTGKGTRSDLDGRSLKPAEAERLKQFVAAGELDKAVGLLRGIGAVPESVGVDGRAGKVRRRLLDRAAVKGRKWTSATENAHLRGLVKGRDGETTNLTLDATKLTEHGLRDMQLIDEEGNYTWGEQQRKGTSAKGKHQDKGQYWYEDDHQLTIARAFASGLAESLRTDGKRVFTPDSLDPDSSLVVWRSPDNPDATLTWGDVKPKLLRYFRDESTLDVDTTTSIDALKWEKSRLEQQLGMLPATPKPRVRPDSDAYASLMTTLPSLQADARGRLDKVKDRLAELEEQRDADIAGLREVEDADGEKTFADTTPITDHRGRTTGELTPDVERDNSDYGELAMEADTNDDRAFADRDRGRQRVTESASYTGRKRQKKGALKVRPKKNRVEQDADRSRLEAELSTARADAKALTDQYYGSTEFKKVSRKLDRLYASLRRRQDKNLPKQPRTEGTIADANAELLTIIEKLGADKAAQAAVQRVRDLEQQLATLASRQQPVNRPAWLPAELGKVDISKPMTPAMEKANAGRLSKRTTERNGTWHHSGVPRALHGIANTLYRTAHDRLHRMSPWLARTLSAPVGKDTEGRTFTMGWRIKTNEWMGELGKLGLDNDGLQRAYEKLQDGKEHGAGAKAMRDLLTRLGDYVREVDPTFDKDTLPVVWNLDRVLDKPGELREVLRDAKVGDPDALIKSLHQSRGVSGFTVFDDGETPKTILGVRRDQERLKAALPRLRELGFLKNDAPEILTGLIDSATRYAEWGRRFGVVQQVGDKQVFDASAVYNALMNETLSESDRAEVRSITRGITRSNTHTIPRWVRVANSGFFAATALRYLLFSGVASIPELAIAPLRGRQGVVGSVIALNKHLARAAVTDRKGTRQLAETLGVIGNQVVRHSLQQLMMMDELTVGKTVSRASDTFFKVNGQHKITELTRMVSMLEAQDFLHHHAERALAGDKTSARYLKELHVDPEQALAGRTDHNPQWKDAVHQFVEQSIANPEAGAMPAWMNDPRFAVFASLKKFVFGLFDRVHRSAYHEVKAGKMAPAMASIAGFTVVASALGALAETIREELKYPSLLGVKRPGGEKPWEEKALRVFSATGLQAHWQLAAGPRSASDYGGNMVLAALNPTLDWLWSDMADPKKGWEAKAADTVPVATQLPWAEGAIRDLLTSD
ncbi:hypothetical protein HNR62_000288 [Oceanisphaera litoralis]|uniref:hypothetical protein n=1 Tax=Oceanisphaera litoralis TaxID=225144 RepID=UPI00195B1AAD|nr:hypothetical protein [Oceanisphaera litoralis]MBM7454459.1 hypothetical protein [Oceanisphaera litoralis]